MSLTPLIYCPKRRRRGKAPTPAACGICSGDTKPCPGNAKPSPGTRRERVSAAGQAASKTWKIRPLVDFVDAFDIEHAARSKDRRAQLLAERQCPHPPDGVRQPHAVPHLNLAPLVAGGKRLQDLHPHLGLV